MNNLYENLMNLVRESDAFYYVDHELNGATYRVFSYRLASYTDFLLPGALECRGHMFRIEGDDVELVSLPFEKFFNLNENPMTMDLDLGALDFVHDKRDGSLISTFLHEDMICLKSKTSIGSDQALDATRTMNEDMYLYGILRSLALSGHTASMEYTAPDNRIVLPYQERELKILGVRCNKTGEYVDYATLYSEFPNYMVDDHTHKFDSDNTEELIHAIYEETGIEGYVVGLQNGQRFKVKTNEYVSLHRAKDSINSNRRLFEVALNDATDDLRMLFVDDPYTLDRITEMEQIVGKAYNGTVEHVESFHRHNSGLSRKDYAILGQKELSKMEFGLAMQKYTGREPNYKEQVMKNFKLFVEDNDEQV
jgi:T4 RnlA family RNA ligase